MDCEHNQVTPLQHYLDNFLTIGPPQSSACQRNLDTLKHLCYRLSVPLALEKSERPLNLPTIPRHHT